jgi:hypothetical protein
MDVIGIIKNPETGEETVGYFTKDNQVITATPKTVPTRPLDVAKASQELRAKLDLQGMGRYLKHLRP